MYKIEGGRDPLAVGVAVAFDLATGQLALRPLETAEAGEALPTGETLLLGLALRGRLVSFSARIGEECSGRRWVHVVPRAQAFDRRQTRRVGGDPSFGHAIVESLAAPPERARIDDAAPSSLRISFDAGARAGRAAPARVRFVDGPRAGKLLPVDDVQPRGLRGAAAGEALLRRPQIEAASFREPFPVPERLAAGAAQEGRVPLDAGSEACEIETLSGGILAARINWSGEPFVGPTVVVPPSWGETKESHVLLALTLVESFRQQGEPLTVIRYDGIEKPGESRGSQTPGRSESAKRCFVYTFSQGASDLEAVVAWARARHRDADASVALISFSGGSIEARRFLAYSREAGCVRLWVSIVGALDVRSAAKGLSGGVDLISLYGEGRALGAMNLMGMVVDVDRLGDDSVRGRMAEIDDVARDFERIDVPIVWYHGAYDAWTHVGMAELALARAHGSPASIRVIPTGHRLRSSALAGRVFRAIAAQVAERTLGRRIEGRAPARADLVAQRREELRSVAADRRDDTRAPARRETGTDRGFWKRYMLGPDAEAGYRLLTGVDAYRAFMRHQLALLEVDVHHAVADLGCGTGAFAEALASGEGPVPRQLLQLDHVLEAVREAGAPVADQGVPVARICGSMNLAAGASLPLADGCLDRVMLSLVVSYLDAPSRLIDEVFRVLRPGGRVVVSTLVPDADTSRLYAHGRLYLETLSDGGGPASGDLDSRAARGARSLLNGAETILDEERRGRFVFRTGEELAALLRARGFEPAGSAMGLGRPAQAVIVAADRPPTPADRRGGMRRTGDVSGRRSAASALRTQWQRLVRTR